MNQMAEPRRPTEHPNKGFLLRAQLAFVFLGGLYLLVILLLVTPFFQTHLLYMHAVQFPFFPQFDVPEKYGLAPGKTLNFRIQTSDNISLGAWFVLSDPFYRSIPIVPNTPSLESHVPYAIRTRPTILFFHGNAASRAAPYRVTRYSEFSSHIGANVLAIDYRGFGDSTGNPSQDGLARDAQAAWDWLVNLGAKPQDILLVGHSLGAAVAVRLAAELECDGVTPRGLVLISPFSSIRSLLDTYAIMGVFPLGASLAVIPGGSKLISWALIHKFDTLSLIPNISAPILIAHAEDDWEVPSTHSDALFDALLEPLLPPLPIPPSSPGTWSTGEWSAFTNQRSERTKRREELVTHTTIPNFGTLKQFQRTSVRASKVIVLKTLYGGHKFGTMEGVNDVVRKIFHFDLYAK